MFSVLKILENKVSIEVFIFYTFFLYHKHINKKTNVETLHYSSLVLNKFKCFHFVFIGISEKKTIKRNHNKAFTRYNEKCRLMLFK